MNADDEPHGTSAFRELTPPNNKDAELSVLGAILREPMVANEVIATGMKPEDFYQRRHQLIYAAMLEVFRDGRAPDAVLTAAEIARRGQTEATGSPEILTSIWEQVITAANIEHYVREVRNAAMLRRLIATCRQGEEAGFRAEGRPEEIVDRVSHEVYRIALEHGEGKAEPVAPIIQSFLEEIDDRAAAGTGPPGIRSPWPDLDKMTNGFQPGQLILIAARPAVGKSSAATNIAVHAGMQLDVPVLFFTLEVDRKQVAINMICSVAGVEVTEVASGAISHDEAARTRLDELAVEFGKAKIFVDDTSGLDVLQLRAKSRHMVHHEGVGLIIVDYLQLMRGPSRAENKEQEIAGISAALKGVALDLGIPVIAVAQINRAVESRDKHKPRLSDLRGSGALEMDADMVLMLYREDYYEEGATETDGSCDVEASIIVAKNRIGRTGEVPLIFQRKYLRFVSKAYGWQKDDAARGGDGNR